MTAEPALKLVETEEVETKALTIVDEAKAIVVRDAETYTKAGHFWKDIRAMRSEVAATFDPLIKQAHELHKNTLSKKNEIDKPLEIAERQVKSLMGAYDAEQERIRKAEQDRLAEIARKEEEARIAEELRILEEERKAEEERLMQAAIEAEKSGNKAQAEELINVAEERSQEAAQAAAEIQAAPVYVPPVVVPKATPKLAGGPVYQTRWKHQVVNLMDLVKAVASGRAPINALQTNYVFLGQQARSLKEHMNIPGVRAYAERV